MSLKLISYRTLKALNLKFEIVVSKVGKKNSVTKFDLFGSATNRLNVLQNTHNHFAEAMHYNDECHSTGNNPCWLQGLLASLE